MYKTEFNHDSDSLFFQSLNAAQKSKWSFFSQDIPICAQSEMIRYKFRGFFSILNFP